MNLSRPSLHGLCVVLAATLMAPPVAAKPAKSAKSKQSGTSEAVKPTSRAIDPEVPEAGDELIPDDELEPGQVGPGGRATSGSRGGGPSVGISRKPNIGSDQIAYGFDREAAEAFDAGNYGEAARLWGRALDALAENQSNHVTRSAMLMNAVTAYEQLFVDTGDVEMLRRGQTIISDYLRLCKKRWGTGCDRYPETTEARKRMEEIMKRIEEAAPRVAKIPPEIDTAPGGRPYNRMITQPAAPAWIGPAFAIGVGLAGGGAALVYWSRTDSRFDPVAEDVAASTMVKLREGEDDGTDTGTDGTDTGTDTGTTTTSAAAIELPPETKGDLLTAVGIFTAAAGIGLIVLASVKLAKHRRLNRERASQLSVVPAMSPFGGGLSLSGRF